MKQLTLEDTQQLLTSVQYLYSLKNLDTFGQDSLAILEQLVPTEASVFINQKFDLTERDRLILNLLQPHLIQAYQTVQRLKELQQQLAQLQHALDQREFDENFEK